MEWKWEVGCGGGREGKGGGRGRGEALEGGGCVDGWVEKKDLTDGV